jgi:F-type H+-transporting ATPase subunit delta
LIGAKVSKRYAKALLSIGQEDGNYERYGKDLQEFAAICSENKTFYEVVSNRIFSSEERKKVLDLVLGRNGLTDMVKNFLRVLLEKNRIGAIQDIADYYGRLTDEIRNIARAEIVTARPLKKETLANVEKALTGLTSKKMKVQLQEDPSLIGGIIVKIGDLVLDGSVRAQIEALKVTL